MCFELDASINGYFDKFAFNLNNFVNFSSISVIFVTTKSSYFETLTVPRFAPNL